MSAETATHAETCPLPETNRRDELNVLLLQLSRTLDRLGVPLPPIPKSRSVYQLREIIIAFRVVIRLVREEQASPGSRIPGSAPAATDDGRPA